MTENKNKLKTKRYIKSKKIIMRELKNLLLKQYFISDKPYQFLIINTFSTTTTK